MRIIILMVRLWFHQRAECRVCGFVLESWKMHVSQSEAQGLHDRNVPECQGIVCARPA